MIPVEVFSEEDFKRMFTPLPGLEGPFRFATGRVLYYDPAEGAYYDRRTDMYLPKEEDPSSWPGDGEPLPARTRSPRK